MPMKKTVSILAAALPALLLLLPAVKLVFSCFGYSFELTWPALWAAGIAAAAVVLVVLSLKKKIPEESKRISVVLAFTAPLSLVVSVFYFVECGVWAVPGVVVWVACSIYLAARHGRPLAVKIVALALALLLLRPVGLFGNIIVAFSDFGLNTVVRTEESPDGKHYAELIDSDHGATGGDTLVKVYRRGGFHAILFSVTPKPQTVYVGPWGMSDYMELYWKSDNCLVVNGEEHIIK